MKEKHVIVISIAFSILDDVTIEGDDYIAESTTIKWLKDEKVVSEDIDKITINKDSKYLKIEDDSNAATLKFT